MNILPKKRWHVRTKDNIARVRRDEAAAREEEQKRKDKLELAESEARINFLRRQSGLPERTSEPSEARPDGNASTSSISTSTGSFDLFADYRTHIKTTNKDLEKERKEEQEKYEKKIGYLTYLGQDTNEALKVNSWYEVAPKRPDVSDTNTTEADLKHKLSQDPLTLINALLPREKKTEKRPKKRSPSPEQYVSAPISPKSVQKLKKHKKEKKHKKHKSHKDERKSKSERRMAEVEDNKREKLERLRKERMRREANEKKRQEALFATKDEKAATISNTTPAPTPNMQIVQKYNSQFNPEIAKQNML